MNPTTLKRFSVAMMALCSAFNREADKAVLMAYEMGLEDLSAEQIEASVREAVRTRKFMPTVAELRELAGEITPEARAVLAWEAFSKSSLNPYHTVDFDDPVINATVRNLGGWRYVCSIEEQKDFEVFLRQRFERAYSVLYRSGISSEQAAPLIGLYDEVNCLSGYPAMRPVMIPTGLPAPAVRIRESPRYPSTGIESVKRIGQA